MAYDVLSDAKKRQQYDLGGTDEYGNANGGASGFHDFASAGDFSNMFQGAGHGGFPGFSFGSNMGFGSNLGPDIFEQLFQQMGQG